MLNSDYLEGVLPLALKKFTQSQKADSYLNDPVLWAEEYLGIQLWSKQKEILYSIRDNRRTAVAAGHGVGKSFVAAVAMAWWVDVHPKNSQETFVASTAPFQEQITTILWDNLRNIHTKSKERYQKGIVDHCLPGYITGDNKWKLENGETIGQGRKPPDNKEDSGFQGKHATYLLVIGDEAAGLSGKLIQALGNIATADTNRQMLIANPTDPMCFMASIWKQKDKTWNTMHISVFDAPTITKESGFDLNRIQGMSGWDYINDMKADHGEDSPVYISRVLGQWAFEAGNTVYTEEDLASAGNTVIVPDSERLPELGMDVARSENGDSTFVYKVEFGEVWDTDDETGDRTQPTGRYGLRIRKLAGWKGAPLSGTNPDNPSTAMRADGYMKALGARVMKYDAAGIGKAVEDAWVDMAVRWPWIAVYGSNPPLRDKMSYINLRAEQYFELKRLMYRGELDLDPADTELLDELRGIVYEYSDKGIIKIESKQSMRNRGRKSPDRADAVWYAALDSSYWMDDPIAQMKPGEKTVVPVDDYSALYSEIYGAGMPV